MSTKLVEVALPLEAISKASQADKDSKTGTIKNIHKWFAPMPTPAWRALLFASLVDDPGEEAGREELLKLIVRLVPEGGGAPDAATLDEARKLIREATGDHPPSVFDPFCGGGSTLVEAQRLGLQTFGSDLNPVAALITRTIAELVPGAGGHPALHEDTRQLGFMMGGPIDGLLADCAHYAERVRDAAWTQIGYLYPLAPDQNRVGAWLWARTVRCINPACLAIVPLASSFWLSKRKAAEKWLDPVDVRPGHAVRLEIGSGLGGPPAPTVAHSAARCLVCQEPIPLKHVRSEGKAGRMGVQLMAAAVEGPNGRVFLSATDASSTVPVTDGMPPAIDLPMPDEALGFRTQAYGLANFAQLFTPRQQAALEAFSEGVRRVPEWVMAGGGDEAYAATLASVLSMGLGKLVGTSSTQSRWYIDKRNGSSQAIPAFGRQALPMVWDFAETNPFGGTSGDWMGHLLSISRGLRTLPTSSPGSVFQRDARSAASSVSGSPLVATDPPYFAQIGYADLSDFFYPWLRLAMKDVHPDLFTTVATPKTQELIAAPYRHGGSERAAYDYFVSGFTDTFRSLSKQANQDSPMLIVYAHRQEASGKESEPSTAWDAMLTSIMAAGLRIVGTWPIHASHSSRQRALQSNALASYVVLVCRQQLPDAKVVDRQGFIAALHAHLPKAIRRLQQGAISSIDLGQASIGPGMAVFSSFAKVIEPTGQAMSVRSALELIIQVQNEVLDEFVGDLDPETRWAMGWYRLHGFDDGSIDDAEKLLRTTNTSLDALRAAGIVEARAGKARLRRRDELSPGWSPLGTSAPTVWEVTQHLAERLSSSGWEGAGPLFRSSLPWVDDARALAYWLSGTAATRGRAKEALEYDALITSWPVLLQEAALFHQPAMSETEV